MKRHDWKCMGFFEDRYWSFVEDLNGGHFDV